MIFISYRKEDSIHLALALADKLAEHFGDNTVFVDRNDIAPGDHWRDTIQTALSRAAVVLAPIGPLWLKTYDDYGQRRIDRDDDVLANELCSALDRHIPVIPLWLQGIKPLPTVAFPKRLADLGESQGIQFDVQRDLPLLLARLEHLTGLRRHAPTASAHDNPHRNSDTKKPWHIPDTIASLFKGRDAVLESLRNCFLQAESSLPDPAATRQVLTGLGGIGKTRLAIEYAWAYRDSYAALLFVVADTPDQLRRSIAELSAPQILDLEQPVSADEEMRYAAVVRWLIINKGWLLIIDNADEKPSRAAVQALLPQLHGGHVIITSRSTWWPKSFRRNELDFLSLDAATTFLLERTADERRTTPQDEVVAAELARELGGLALAVEQAGAYIQNRDGGLSLADYLGRWREERDRVSSWCDESVMHYARSVAITWETTTRALGTPALALFRMLAWFAPDPIPRALVSNDGVLPVIAEALDLSGGASDGIDPEEALSELIAYSMTKKVDKQGIPCVGLHRVVLQMMRDRMPPEAKNPSIVGAARMLVLFAPRDAYRPEHWFDWRLLIAHAEAIWTVMKAEDEQYWDIELMKMLALYHMGQDNFPLAVPIQRDVLRLVQQRLSPDDPEVFLAQNDLALMLDNSHEEERESLYKSALAGRLRVLGDESTEYGETLHNYAVFLTQFGRLTEAEPLLRQAMAVHTRAEGPNHWRTLMAESSLIDVLSAKGEKTQAATMTRASWERKRQHLGEEHPDTLITQGALARRTEEQGDCSAAGEMYRSVVDVYTRTLGPAHSSTLGAVKALAGYCWRNDNVAEAEALLRQLLDTSEGEHGSEHHFSLSGTCSLAELYAANGDYVHAEPLYARALAGLKRAFGIEDQRTLSVMTVYADLLHHRGQPQQAEALFKEVMNINAKVHGPEHQTTLASTNRLAIFLDNAGKGGDAEALYRQTLHGIETKRGKDHRDALIVAQNLADLLRQNGNLEDAESLFRRVLETAERQHGAEHLMSFLAANTLAVFYARTDRYELAEPLYERALDGMRRLQGSKHPETLAVMGNLADLLSKTGEFARAKALRQEILEIHEGEQGPHHPSTLSSLESLADLLETAGEVDASDTLRDKFIERAIGSRDSAGNLLLRRLALQFYLREDYPRAEELLRVVVGRNFDVPSIRCHLARIMILTGRETEAQAELALAWQHRGEGQPYVLPRILFLDALLRYLAGSGADEPLARIKFLLNRESAFCEWKIEPVLCRVKDRLSEETFALLQSLAAALGNQKKLGVLAHFGAWSDLSPLRTE